MAALLCACALPLGCSLVQQVAASGIDKPKLSFKSAQLAEVSLDAATVNLVFTVDNPNEQGLSLAESDYLIKVEGKQLVAGKPPGKLQIPGHGSADVTLPASVKFSELASSLSALLSQRSVAYQAAGHLGVDTPLGRVALPFSHQGRLELPKVPEVSVGSPTLKDLSLGSATLMLPVTLSNSNGFALPLGAVTGSLQIAGADVGSVLTPEVGMLAANGKQTVAVPVKLQAQALFIGNVFSHLDKTRSTSIRLAHRADGGELGELAAILALTQELTFPALAAQQALVDRIHRFALRPMGAQYSHTDPNQIFPLVTGGPQTGRIDVFDDAIQVADQNTFGTLFNRLRQFE